MKSIELHCYLYHLIRQTTFNNNNIIHTSTLYNREMTSQWYIYFTGTESMVDEMCSEYTTCIFWDNNTSYTPKNVRGGRTLVNKTNRRFNSTFIILTGQWTYPLKYKYHVVNWMHVKDSTFSSSLGNVCSPTPYLLP